MNKVEIKEYLFNEINKRSNITMEEYTAEPAVKNFEEILREFAQMHLECFDKMDMTLEDYIEEML
jgi:hypothetical protein